MSQRSFFMSAFNAHFLDDRAELLDLALQDRVLLRGARADRLGADLAQPPGGFRMAHGRRGFLLQALDHFARRLRRREKTVSTLGLEDREAQLAPRRHLRA